MDNTKYIALSRQMALWKQMDIVSNNIANMNTTGYKQDDAVLPHIWCRRRKQPVLAACRFISPWITASIRILPKGLLSIPAILLIWCRGG